MGLFRRISDIVSANISEMVERHENPEMLLKQAVREMHEAIKTAEQDTARLLANEKKLKRELTKNEAEAQRWTSEAERAVDAGDDDVARRALSRRQEHEKVVQALQDQVAVAEPATETLRHQLDGMNAKLAEAKRNLATLSARKQSAEVRKKALANMASKDDLALSGAAFEKFDRMREKVEQAEAEADALTELRGLSGQPSASTHSLDDELAALKARRKTDK